MHWSSGNWPSARGGLQYASLIPIESVGGATTMTARITWSMASSILDNAQALDSARKDPPAQRSAVTQLIGLIKNVQSIIDLSYSKPNLIELIDSRGREQADF